MKTIYAYAVMSQDQSQILLIEYNCNWTTKRGWERQQAKIRDFVFGGGLTRPSRLESFDYKPKTWDFDSLFFSKVILTKQQIEAL